MAFTFVNKPQSQRFDTLVGESNEAKTKQVRSCPCHWDAMLEGVAHTASEGEVLHRAWLEEKLRNKENGTNPNLGADPGPGSSPRSRAPNRRLQQPTVHGSQTVGAQVARQQML